MTFGATILDATGHRLTADEKALFADVRPFGFILFARNIDGADQVRALCNDFREAAGEDVLITIDQEGGRVQRLRAPIAREWIPPLDFVAAAGDAAPRAMYLRYRLIADELRKLGIDSNCAPTADLERDETHPFLHNRLYGADVAHVVEISRAVAKAHMDGGVLPVMKHLPGHGRAAIDSHKDLPRVTTNLEELHTTDFAVFRGLNDLPAAMTAHLVYEGLGDLPATLSPEIVALIRNDIGFNGLLMTDDLSMHALQGDRAKLAPQSLAAGVDVALYCNAPLGDRAAVAHACGDMTDAAQRRAKAALAVRKSVQPLDTKAAEAELKALNLL